MDWLKVGEITNVYKKIGVAAIQLKYPLPKGSRVLIFGHTTNFKQQAYSIELNHEQIELGQPQTCIGLRLDQKARKHDGVYLPISKDDILDATYIESNIQRRIIRNQQRKVAYLRHQLHEVTTKMLQEYNNNIKHSELLEESTV